MLEKLEVAEKRYEEIHDVMNELKLKRELVKENYREQIDEILEQKN